MFLDVESSFGANSFQTFFEALPQMACVIDGSGELRFANRLAREFLAETDRLKIHDKWWSAVHADDLSNVKNCWRQAQLSKSTTEFGCRVRRSSDAAYRWMLVKMAPAHKENGEFSNWIATCTDVHDHRESVLAIERLTQRELEARTAVSHERQRLFETFDHLPVSVGITLGPEHRLIYSNSHYFLPEDQSAQIGESLIETIPSLKNHPLIEAMDEVFATGRPVIRRDIRFKERINDGFQNHGFASVALLPSRDPSGQIVGVTSFHFDSTERMEVSERLRESEERLRIAISAASVAVWEWNLKTGQLWSSDRFYEMFGLEEVPLNWSVDAFLKLVHPDDRVMARETLFEMKHLDSASRFELTYRILLPSGQTRWIRSQGAIERDENGVVIKRAGALMDVTTAKEAETAIQRACEKAEAADRAKSTFIAHMSHEFRTPLSALLGFSEFLGKDNLPAATRASYSDGIRRNGKLLIKLVEDVLDLSRVEAGGLAIELQTFDPKALVAEVVDLFAAEAQQKNLKIEFKNLEILNKTFCSDPARVRQILTNVIGNAVKFTEAGRVVIEAMRDHLDGVDYFHLKISDTGIGLSVKQIEQIFKPFGQADRSTRRKYGGTGLGLFISKRLAQLLQGDLVLERSAQGQGSVFTIRIADQAEHSPQVCIPEGLSKVEDRIRSALRGKRLLIVEDTEDIRELLAVYFGEIGVETEEACDGVEGVERALANEYDAILMDLNMPRMDGFTAVEYLREQGYARPIIAVTALAQPEDRIKCLEVGFDAYVTKPVQLHELELTIWRLLRRAGAKTAQGLQIINPWVTSKK